MPPVCGAPSSSACAGTCISRPRCWGLVKPLQAALGSSHTRASQAAPLSSSLHCLAPSTSQAETLTRLLHDFYTIDQKYYGFVHPFNHRQVRLLCCTPLQS